MIVHLSAHAEAQGAAITPEQARVAVRKLPVVPSARLVKARGSFAASDFVEAAHGV
jgi:hypothetical protein